MCRENREETRGCVGKGLEHPGPALGCGFSWHCMGEDQPLELKDACCNFFIKRKVFQSQPQHILCVCAKSLQLCLTLCNSMDYPPGSSVHGIFLDRNTGEGCHFLLQGIFRTQVWNPHLLHLLHWQAGSLTLAPPGKPHPNHTLSEP